MDWVFRDCDQYDVRQRFIYSSKVDITIILLLDNASFFNYVSKSSLQSLEAQSWMKRWFSGKEFIYRQLTEFNSSSKSVWDHPVGISYGEPLKPAMKHGMWNTEKEGPHLVVKSLLMKQAKIVLLESGFVFMTASGATIVRDACETFVSVQQGQDLIDADAKRLSRQELARTSVKVVVWNLSLINFEMHLP